jgi:hypothetical protein
VVTHSGPKPRRALVAGLGAAVALIVTGCTSDGGKGPTFTPPTSTYSYLTQPSPTPVSTPPVTTGPNVRPGEKPPTFDPKLEINAPGAADAYAKYWERVLDWGYATTDSSLARTAYAPTCDGCERFMKIFDGARTDGVHFRGGRISFVASTIQPNDHHNGATAISDITVSIQALQAVDGSGRIVESDPAVPHATDRVWMQWTGKRWIVVDWKHVVQK